MAVDQKVKDLLTNVGNTVNTLLPNNPINKLTNINNALKNDTSSLIDKIGSINPTFLKQNTQSVVDITNNNNGSSRFIGLNNPLDILKT
ncbi:hypothetical protein IJU97_03810 [bacterium]|nr:hypothetical protein [bacterium]